MKRTVFILLALVIAFSPALSGCNKIFDMITGGGDSEEITAPPPPAPPISGTAPETPAGPPPGGPGAGGDSGGGPGANVGVGTGAGPGGQPGAPAVSGPTMSPDEVKASVNGTYTNLLITISVPDDHGSYGDFYDWGYYSGTSYAGYSNLPAGYWVYVYPNWYIWGSEAGTAPVTGGLDTTRASVNGKYYNLLTTISVPDDQGSYGDFYDWGYWSGTSYAGYENLPAGYWVYAYPNWYIWGNQQ